MQFITYNNIIDLFRLFATNHKQIKRFGSGQISDIDSMINQAGTFPIMWANLIDVNFPSLNTKNYQFNILIFDTLDKDKNNEQDIFSDSLTIGEDLCRYLHWTQSRSYDVQLPIQMELFTERFTDFVSGCNVKVTIQVDADLQNNCGIAGLTDELNLPNVLN